MIYWHKALCLDAALLEKYRTQINRLLSGEYQGSDLDLKKLANHRLYTIRLNHSDRLLFTTIQKNGVNYLVMLEEILEHDYQKSRFLKPHVLQNFIDKNSDAISEIHFDEIPELPVKLGSDTEFKAVEFYNEKFIVLNEAQNQAVKTALPMVVSGPAGSGKTTVAMRVLAQCAQQYADSTLPILYVTESVRLKNNLKEIWDASPDKSNNVELRTYAELFGNVKIVGKQFFYDWFGNRKKDKKIIDAEVAYQEFRLFSACASLEDYLKLGAKQTQFLDEEKRKSIWEIYQKYLTYLKDMKSIDPAFVEIPHRDSYAAIVVDEAQDLSMLQLKQLALAAEKRRVCYCMDSHQSLQDNRSKRPFLLQSLQTFTEREPNHVVLPYSYRCPDYVSQATTPLMAMKKRLTGKADKHEVSEILSAPGAALGNVHWVEPGKLSSEQIRWFEEAKKSKDFAVVTLPEHFDKACELFGTTLVFTPEQIKGLEYKYIAAYRIFDDNIYIEANQALTNDVVDEKFRKPLNRVITAFTRAQEALIIYQEKRHNIENITRAVPHTPWQLTGAVKASTYKEWKQEGVRQQEANNSRQATMITEKLSFSLDKFLSHSQKYFPKAVHELLESSHILDILSLERTQNNKNLFEAIDDKKWEKFIESVINHGIAKLLTMPLDEAENIFATFGTSNKAKQLIDLLRKEVFFIALASSNYLVVENCLKAGFNPNTMNGNGFLPICLAVTKKDKTLIKLLHTHKVDLNLPELGGFNALTAAAVAGDVDIGEYLIDLGADINFNPDKKRLPTLHTAIIENKKDFVAMLLRRGADFNLVAEDQTPVYLATSLNHCEILQLLVQQKGCDLNFTRQGPRQKGDTALLVAAREGNLNAMRILVEAGCDLYGGTRSLETPLDRSIVGKHIHLVEYLLSKGVDPNHKRLSYPIGLAVHHKVYEITELLFKHGARIHSQDDNLLWNVIRDDEYKFAELLLRYGADPDKQIYVPVASLMELGDTHNIARRMLDFSRTRPITSGVLTMSARELATLLDRKDINRLLGTSPVTQLTVCAPPPAPATVIKEPTYIDKLLGLDNASFEKSIGKILSHKNVVKILTEQKTHDGKGIFDAIDSDKLLILLNALQSYLAELRNKGLSESPIDNLLDLPDPNCNLGPSKNAKAFVHIIIDRVFDIAMEFDIVDRIKKCLSRKPKPLYQSDDGSNPLRKAVIHKSIPMLEVLLDYYDPNEDNNQGQTPLMFSVGKNFLEGAALLLDRGADIDKATKNGNTAVRYTIDQDQPRMLTFLIQRGADINKSDKKGSTPLIAAIEEKKYHLADILLNTKKCDVNKTYNGNTALHYAACNGNIDMVNALLAEGAKQIPNNEGMTPIHAALLHPPILIRLIEAGGDINQPDNQGFTPLLAALDNVDQSKEEDVITSVKFLLSKNANTSQVNYIGETALAIAIKTDYRKSTEMLLQNGCVYHMPFNIRLTQLKSIMLRLGKTPQLNQFLEAHPVAPDAESVSITPSQYALLLERKEIYRMIRAKELAIQQPPFMAQPQTLDGEVKSSLRK